MFVVVGHAMSCGATVDVCAVRGEPSSGGPQANADSRCSGLICSDGENVLV